MLPSGGPRYDGKVLLLGPPDRPMVAAVRERGEELGLAMLPRSPRRSPRATCATAWRVSCRPTSADAAVDVAQAVNAGWLELWYQPKLDAGTLDVAGAEALCACAIRLGSCRRPISCRDGDPHFRALSEFVIGVHP